MKATRSTRALRTQSEQLRRRCSSALARHRARAKALGIASLPYGLAELLALGRRADVCTYCRCPLGFDLAFDHATPTSRPGGRFTLDNLRVCCPRCNVLKGSLTAEEFALLRELLARLHPAARADLERRLLSGGQRYCRRG